MSYNQAEMTLIESMKHQSLSELLTKIYDECSRMREKGGITPVDMPITYIGPDYKEGLEGVAQRYTDVIDFLRQGELLKAIELWNDVTEKKFSIEPFRRELSALETALMTSIALVYPINPLAGFMTTCKIVADNLDRMQGSLN
jgi:hypothetical protein